MVAAAVRRRPRIERARRRTAERRAAMKPLRIERSARVLTASFDNPPLNFLAIAMMRELKRVLDDIERDASVGVVVVTSLAMRVESLCTRMPRERPRLARRRAASPAGEPADPPMAYRKPIVG
ncbi:DpgD protein [Burkholderia thailandensis E264]|uniref:DpgD protein n=3 Tax=Burkholderia thailandensis TaxID=57975 RepID=Q2SWT8_BURTA|nr:DpgD protein [Burkholderia thailandensis E264]